MIKFIKDQIKCFQCRVALRKQTRPSDKFLNQCRQLFLDKICPAPIENVRMAKSFCLIYRYGLFSFFGCMFILSGMVVFADMTNVGYGHPLYSFKRFGESVRIKLVPQAGQPSLHQEFAERRLEEMKAIKGNTIPASATDQVKNQNQSILTQNKEVEQLSQQMHQEINLIFSDVEANRIEPARIKIICNDIARILNDDEESLTEIPTKFQQESRNKLNINCAGFLDP